MKRVKFILVFRSNQIKPTNRLCCACCSGNTYEAVQALENGANPRLYIRIILGETSPIFMCAEHGHIDIAKLLIKYDSADIINQNVFFACSPLHHAAAHGQYKMCEFILETAASCNVELNFYDRLGRTPMMEAAEIGSIECIKSILKYHSKQPQISDINKEDRKHCTALSYCLESYLYYDREQKYLDCAVFMVRNGANPNYPMRNGSKRLLHFAAAQGDLKLVKELIKDHHALVEVYDYHDM